MKFIELRSYGYSIDNPTWLYKVSKKLHGNPRIGISDTLNNFLTGLQLLIHPSNLVEL